MRPFVVSLLAAITLTAQTVPGRYIVELTEQPSFRVKRQRILDSQRSLSQTLTARRIRIRASVDTVANALIVESADRGVLESLPGVRKVYAVKYLYPVLDRAVSLMRITEAWQQVGGQSNAGAGIKIGIIDTGIDPYHAGFQDSSLTPPDGYPRYSSDANRPLTNNKIIVARSYDDSSASDLEGHGTAVAMIAAGVPHIGASGRKLSGIAPKAFLGAYRANDGATGRFTTDTILRAIDDAVKDGMDVINMSLGAPGLSRSEDEIVNVAINRAMESGTIVVTAAGNNGPDPMTVGDTGAAPNAISVGSSQNDRAAGSPSVAIPEFSLNFPALPASNSSDSQPLRGSLLDVGLACSVLLPGTLSGKIAVIGRGDCTFEQKLTNAESAGAAAAIVLNNQDDPIRLVMDTGKAQIKSLFLSRLDGITLKQRLTTAPGLEAMLIFANIVPDDPDKLSDFSSRGPTLDLTIKPDLVAIGANVITAVAGTEPNRPETSGYVMASGTSFSAPMVAGAVAVLKGARPGLSTDHYKSLIVNSSTRFPSTDEILVQQDGAGLLNLPGALTNTIAVAPVSVSFGESKGAALRKDFTVTNISKTAESFTVTVRSTDSAKARVSQPSFTLAPGASGSITVELDLTAAQPGGYQGIFEITGATGSASRVAYWAGVRAKEHSRISLTMAPTRGEAGGVVQLLFRAVDGAGFYFDPKVQMSAVSGGGEVRGVISLGAEYPGLYYAEVRLGAIAGVNVFRITAGTVEREYRITGER